jgi:hypothetical protein
MVTLAPQLLRQEPDECVAARLCVAPSPLDAPALTTDACAPLSRTRAMLARLRAHFTRVDVTQMVANRPQLLLRSAAALLDDWQRRPQRKVRPSARPAAADTAASVADAAGVSGAAAADVSADSSASAEAAAAARNAHAEIAAAGRPAPRCGAAEQAVCVRSAARASNARRVPHGAAHAFVCVTRLCADVRRGFGARPLPTLPPLAPLTDAAAAPGARSASAELVGADEEEEEEEEDDADDDDGAGEDDAAFEAALAVAQERARATRGQARARSARAGKRTACCAGLADADAC